MGKGPLHPTEDECALSSPPSHETSTPNGRKQELDFDLAFPGPNLSTNMCGPLYLKTLISSGLRTLTLDTQAGTQTRGSGGPGKTQTTSFREGIFEKDREGAKSGHLSPPSSLHPRGKGTSGATPGCGGPKSIKVGIKDPGL